jgi:serine phosphatase RsbU (regulator of sigma subunit)
MLLNLSELSNESLHRQISNQLIDKIVDGELETGAGLDPVREFGRSQRVGTRTAKRAYEWLEREGFIISGGNGDYRVAEVSLELKEIIRTQRRLSGENHHYGDLHMSREWIMARQIQQQLLPASLPDDALLCIAASCSPSRSVSGDFYDCIPVDDVRCCVAIADACGKGLPAALMAMQIQAVLKFGLRETTDLTSILGSLNTHLTRYTPADKFATMLIGIFDKASHDFTWASAGHHAPILVKRDGSIEFLKQGDCALGMSEISKFHTSHIRMHPGDSLVLYTDGVTEAMNARKIFYGEKRLKASILRHRHENPSEMLGAVLEDLDAFTANCCYQDDRTIMILKTGKGR